MRQQHMNRGSSLPDVTAFLARHPRLVLTVLLVLCLLASQGTASAEFALVEPSSGHAATTGP